MAIFRSPKRSASEAADGASSEKNAERFLKTQGLQLIERNYACRWGEIDRIMLDQGNLVFVEVRARSDKRGAAAASVTAKKQEKLRKSAAVFLQEHPEHANLPCRFDVIALDGNAQPDWIRNAF